jgi:hypothetical protein
MQTMLSKQPFPNKTTFRKAMNSSFIICIRCQIDAAHTQIVEGVLQQQSNGLRSESVTLQILFSNTEMHFRTTLKRVDVHQFDLADWSAFLCVNTPGPSERVSLHLLIALAHSRIGYPAGGFPQCGLDN